MAGPVRQPIDQASLERYLNEYVPAIKTPLELKQFGFGQSNPTYQVTDSIRNRYVLRKKPPGKLLSKTAHQVDREYRVIHALEHTDVAVPRAVCLCEDDSIIGTAFYIMGFLEGRMFENPSFPGVSPDDREEMWHDAVRTLAKLHRVNVKEAGLETFGKQSGFYNRQIRTFGRLAKSQAAAKDQDTAEAVGQLPHFGELVSFFQHSQPRDRGVLVHGDYKIDNLVFHKTEPRVIGVLDWEMRRVLSRCRSRRRTLTTNSTVGHPLADLCNLLQPYAISNATPSWPRIHADYAFLDRSRESSTNAEFPGLPTREQAIQWYEETAGFQIPAREMTWATAFALFRDSIIFQGIAARYAIRQASSAKAMEYGREMRPFAEMSWAMVQNAQGAQSDRSKL